MPAPDLDHPRRCQVKRRSGKPCRRWALRGSEYCALHGGRRRKNPTCQAPTVYSRFLTRSLRQAIEQQLERAPAEQLQLYEELAVMRRTALESVMLYDQALQSKKPELIDAATMLVRDSMNEVAGMAESAARVAASSAGKVDAAALAYVIQQVTKIAIGIFGEDDPKMKEFARALREDVMLPDGSGDGTDLTPDADAEDMDDTIPGAP